MFQYCFLYPMSSFYASGLFNFVCQVRDKKNPSPIVFGAGAVASSVVL
jgi:hypothetical protein